MGGDYLPGLSLFHERPPSPVAKRVLTFVLGAYVVSQALRACPALISHQRAGGKLGGWNVRQLLTPSPVTETNGRVRPSSIHQVVGLAMLVGVPDERIVRPEDAELDRADGA